MPHFRKINYQLGECRVKVCAKPRGWRGGGMGQLMLVYFVAMFVWIVAQLLIMTLSRYRELAADRSGAIVTGQPGNLASALLKINGAMSTIPKEELQKVEKANAFFIIPAASGFSIAELLATHPPVNQRIERLQRLQEEMEGRY